MWEQCFTLPFWAGLDEVMNQYIDSVTLEQLSQQLPACQRRLLQLQHEKCLKIYA